jgi:hypothetical protein
MAVVNLGSSSIYDPMLPQRAQQQQQPPQPQNAPMMPNTDQVDAPSAQQDNFPVPMDPGIAAMLARAATPQQQAPPIVRAGSPSLQQPYGPQLPPPSNAPRSYGPQQAPSPLAPNYPQSFPVTGVYNPSPLTPPQSVKGNYLNRSLGDVDARGAPYPMHSATSAAPGGVPNLTNDTFKGLTDEMVTGSQPPASGTPQGWNLFAALGNALSALLGHNVQGQPQGMSGLVRAPPRPAPTQTLTMPTPTQQAARYQGRTLLG